MARTSGYKKNTKKYRDIHELIGYYVIECNIGGILNYYADNTLTKREWTNKLYKAKRYHDLSAADLKVLNLKHDKHPMLADVKYVTQNLRLVEPRRD